MSGTRPRRYERAWVPGSDTKTRRCLRCRQDFRSAHRGNRVCPTCTHANAREAPDIDGYSIPGLQERKGRRP